MASADQSVNFGADDVHTREPLVSREQIREKIRRALNLYAGRGRRYSVEQLAEGSGVPKRAVQAAMAPVADENFRPLTLENLASITKFLRAQFASAYLDLSDLGAFELADGQPPLPKVLATAEPQESQEDERRRLIRRLAELEDVL